MAEAGRKENRRFERLRDPCRGTLAPVHRVFGGGPSVRGVSRDFDSEGGCITTHEPLPKGARYKFRFRLPKSVGSVYQGLPAEFPGRVRDVRALAVGRHSLYEVVLEWDAPLAKLVEATVASYHRKIGACILLLVALAAWLRWDSMDYFWYAPLIYLYGLSLLVFLASRFFFAWLHRCPPAAGYTPSVSMVISVRNEEKAIAQTVEACLRTDYPTDKKEVIVVDDGSTDSTPLILQELAQRYPELSVRTIKPSGKRFGMAEGVRRATGEILVFLDSDTYIYPDGLRHIVCGFEDPTLGAVSGCTGVENADKNALTGLQEVRYLISFRLLKTAESFFSCVTCCPGCLSAYRRKYVLEVLDDWLTQKYFGRLATFGDDRSLTNFILRDHRVIFNDQARAATLVPETWSRYLRQQLRWKKSWMRETYTASGFMWRKQPLAALSFYSAAVLSILSPAMAMRVVILDLGGQGGIFLYYVAGLFMIGLINSFYYRYQKPSPRWLLGVYWMLTSLLITGPQTYYAMLTVHKNHWGTR